jgi:hypothetical protein
MSSLESAFETVRIEFEAGCVESARKARAALIGELQELLRRFRSYEGEGEWISVLLDGASLFVQQSALFTVHDSSLELRGERGLNLPERLVMDVSTARAMADAISSKDVVVALRSATEVGTALSAKGALDSAPVLRESPKSAQAAGRGTDQERNSEDLAVPSESVVRELLKSVPEQRRAALAPILNGERVVAVLFAPLNVDADAEALEFLASMSSIVLERQSNASVAVQIAPLSTVVKQPEEVRASPLPNWANLTEDERNRQIRAQRFARVKVAEAQLAHPDAARAGREQNNVYLFLKSDIDSARESYRAQFMRDKSMVDYFHLELVRIAAEGDESKLGAEYPGPLA